MIVVAIIGILAAIAIPKLTECAQLGEGKAGRSDALAADGQNCLLDPVNQFPDRRFVVKSTRMKSAIVGSVLAVAAGTPLSANAAPQSVCSAGIAGDGAVIAAGNNFIKVAFTPKCSTNVVLNAEDASAFLYRVGAVSVKGKNKFAGSSVGGAVSNMGTCSNTPCDAADATAGLNAAPSS